MQTPRFVKIIMVLAVMTGCAWLLYLMDDGLGICWTHNVVRNWEEFGFFNLHGKLVTNPGGFEVATHPEIYPGHQPMSLYPAFICKKLFSWSPGGMLLYYIAISFIVFVSIRHLLGKSEWAYLMAATAMICPGFVRWQVELDPNATCILLGFPYCAMVLSLLKRPNFTIINSAMLFFLILMFTLLNWTTAFVHFSLLVTMVVMRTVPWRRLTIYVGLSGFVLAIILIVSVLSKLTGEHGHRANFMDFLGGYTWGNQGYGLGMGTKTAFLRLGFVNFIGLLPILILCAWKYFHNGKGRPASLGLAVLPLVAVILGITTMRNYFGHHPWMSPQFILLGITLCFHTGTTSAANADGPGNNPARAGVYGQGLFLTASFICGISVIFFYRIHNANRAGFNEISPRAHGPFGLHCRAV